MKDDIFDLTTSTVRDLLQPSFKVDMTQENIFVCFLNKKIPLDYVELVSRSSSARCFINYIKDELIKGIGNG